MAELENKNQHTLYRFVSLRNPELSKKADQSKRFVFYSEQKEGFFFSKITTRDSADTRWNKLIEISNEFENSSNCIKEESQFLLFTSKDFIEQADWLSSNRTTLDYQIFLKKISSTFKSLEETKIESSLWDNLFYQVVTQKDFYIKETIMHLLVFNNLLKEIKKLSSDADKINAISILVNARVVLPTKLFELESNIQQGSFAKNSNSSENTIEQKKEINRTKAFENSKELENAAKEINLQLLRYNKDFKIAYQKALFNHEQLIAPIISKFYNDSNIAKNKLSSTELEKQNAIDKDVPRYQGPILPKFIFEYPQQVDEKSLVSKLSNESFEILKNLQVLTDVESYYDILKNIEIAYNEEQQIIAENTNYSVPVVIIGGHAVYPSNKKTSLSKREDENTSSAFVPEKFGVRNIGIADYKKVVSHVCCYKAGEVSHIENIMAKELKSKTTTIQNTEEVTQTIQKQQEKENTTDNTTTQRFEMQTEVAKLLAEDRQFNAYSKYSNNSFGQFEVGANYATNTSKEQSNRQAVTQAKDLTNRAMERIVTKISTETVTKTTFSFTEQNIHDFDNRKGDNHVSGVYRFINSIYKNEIYNYGKRMMYEFMIPEPSMLHRSGMTVTDGIIKTPKMPIDPKSVKIINYTSINAGNYLELCTNYNAEPVPFPQSPPLQILTSQQNGDEWVSGARDYSLDITIPQGFKIESITGTITFDRRAEYINGSEHENANGNINIGGMQNVFGNVRTHNVNFAFINEIVDNVHLYIWTWDIYKVYFTLNVTFTINNTAYQTWQTSVYNAIIAGYQKQLDAYNLLLANSATITVKNIETNPGFYRQIEQLVLRKECIAYIMDESKMGQKFNNFIDPLNTAPQNQTIENFVINQNQKMDSYASLVKFMEQAFEWEIMSYNFYPFYWGARQDWEQLYQYENNDPLFRSFMQAGMARVVVTVKPGFENAVLHYMTTGQIWNGGEIPVLGNPLYLSIVDEIREQEYTVEETWETVVPTSLIGIQESGVSITGTGLPCNDECNDHKDKTIIDSTQKLSNFIGESVKSIK